MALVEKHGFFFPPSENERLLLGAQGRRGGITTFTSSSAPGKDRTQSNKGVLNPVLFLRGTWRKGAISKHAG